jgi:hypothetical protein
VETRREAIKRMLNAAALSAVAVRALDLKVMAQPSESVVSKIKPTVTGPIIGGQHGHPFSAYFGDIAQRGYIEEEYFLQGDATHYRPVGELTTDGRWTVAPSGSLPYKTRLLVRRPKDPTKFNGTVIVEWANVSGGYEILFADPPGIYGGYAYAAVSAQHAGVHGFDTDAAGLVQWDNGRYGTLSIPGDSVSYDIYTQAARALRDPSARSGVDPLDGLHVRKLIATGGSQSAGRLITYANAIQPRDGVFDAIMPAVAGGSGSGFDDQVFDPRKLASMSPQELGRIRGTQTQIRSDLMIRVMILNSECEALSYVHSRQPDTDHFRMWEVAGASHAPKSAMDAITAKLSRDFGVLPSTTKMPGLPSLVAWLPVFDAAVMHVNDWIRGGPPPPYQRPIAIEDSKVVRDRFGNAVGGVRLPDLEVPVASYDGGGFGAGTAGLGGQTRPFSSELITQLYATHAIYVAKVTEAVHRAEKAQVILADRGKSYIEDARGASIP